MAKQRSSVRKREREIAKRQREIKKSQKAAEKRERKLNRGQENSSDQLQGTDGASAQEEIQQDSTISSEPDPAD